MAPAAPGLGHPPEDGNFTGTHWTTVFLAAGGTSPEAEAALERLCQKYWYPLYCFVRRGGHTPEDSQDLVQGFFARLLQKNELRRADPAKGRFRAYLLTALKHYLANEWDRANRQKRGGGRKIISLDNGETEMRYAAEPANPGPAEVAYDREWAMALLGRVLTRLEHEYAANSKKQTFDALKPFLTEEEQSTNYAEVAQTLRLSEGNARVTVHRLRQRYRNLLRNEIAETVERFEDVDEELRYLFSAVG